MTKIVGPDVYEDVYQNIRALIESVHFHIYGHNNPMIEPVLFYDPKEPEDIGLDLVQSIYDTNILECELYSDIVDARRYEYVVYNKNTNCLAMLDDADDFSSILGQCICVACTPIYSKEEHEAYILNQFGILPKYPKINNMYFGVSDMYIEYIGMIECLDQSSNTQYIFCFSHDTENKLRKILNDGDSDKLIYVNKGVKK